MAGINTSVDRAAAAHRQAVAIVEAAQAALDRPVARPRSAVEERGIRELAERLRAAASLLAPGWLGGPLDALPASTPLGAATAAELVRVGTAYPLDDASFPVVLPLGHLAFDADARDPRIAGALQAVLLRLLASHAAGSLLVRAVDATGDGFAPFAPLHDAGIMPPPVVDRAGLQAVLTEVEHWVRGGARPDRTLLLVVASWPETTEPEELARVAALAANGPAAKLHLLLGGWPLPPLTDDPSPPLPHTTQVHMQNPHVLVGHPPGESFATAVPPGEPVTAGLNAPVYLDPAPSPELITRVCGELATRAVDQARLSLGELLPRGPLWTRDATAGLDVPIGRSGDTPVTLPLSPIAPHWLVLGRSGSGKTALLLDMLYGLCSQYRPEQLSTYLLDFSGRGGFADFVPQPHDPSSLPHARAVLLETDRVSGLAVLRGLARQRARRFDIGQTLPRIVCVIDETSELLRGDDPQAREASALLSELAQQGGRVGIHLILAGRTLPPEPITAQCRVRIALPGGAPALDPTNDAAAALTVGTAVVNTAGGLGGPRGATRAHEKLIHFPDPYADRTALAGLRHWLWRAGGGPTAEGGQP